MSAEDADPLGSGILRWLIKELDRISVRYQPPARETRENLRPETDKRPEDGNEQPDEQEHGAQ
jgi:hypothetical protein